MVMVIVYDEGDGDGIVYARVLTTCTWRQRHPVFINKDYECQCEISFAGHISTCKFKSLHVSFVGHASSFITCLGTSTYRGYVITYMRTCIYMFVTRGVFILACAHAFDEKMR